MYYRQLVDLRIMSAVAARRHKPIRLGGSSRLAAERRSAALSLVGSPPRPSGACGDGARPPLTTGNSAGVPYAPRALLAARRCRRLGGAGTGCSPVPPLGGAGTCSKSFW